MTGFLVKVAKTSKTLQVAPDFRIRPFTSAPEGQGRNVFSAVAGLDFAVSAALRRAARVIVDIMPAKPAGTG